MEPRFIYISGGYNCIDKDVNVVERYDSISDRWESLPNMNVARSYHSSCLFGTTMYVLSGFGENGLLTNTIEKLNHINLPATIIISRW